MTKGLVFALVLALAALAGCKSKGKATTDEPPGSASMAASGSGPAAASGSEPAAGSGSGSATGGHIVSTSGFTACARYSDPRGVADMPGDD